MNRRGAEIAEEGKKRMRLKISLSLKINVVDY
jgi:hypothetical protein